MSEPYDLRWSRSAMKAVAEQLPENVAAAVLKLILGLLCSHPHRVGKPLQEPFTGLWSARRATHRVIYAIDEDKHLVTIDVIKHRRDAYRP